MEASGMFSEQKYLPNCPSFWEFFRILFLPQEQNAGSVTWKKQKGFSVVGATCLSISQLSYKAMVEQKFN